MIIEKHILVEDETLSVVKTLQGEIDLSIMQLKIAISKGCLWLQKGEKIKRLRRLKTTLVLNQQLHFYYNSDILDQKPLEAKLIEDNIAYSIWYKPAGMLCQGSKWGDHTTINRFVESNLEPQRMAMIVHRLDKMTSGLMIISHQKKIAKAFTQIFEQRKIKKHYRAKVWGICVFPDNLLTIDAMINEKPAISHVRIVQTNPLLNQSLVDVKIETGRKHQIREHLAGIGHPVVGDRLHPESTVSDQVEDLQLCSYQLEFICPVSNQLKSYQLEESLLPSFNNITES